MHLLRTRRASQGPDMTPACDKGHRTQAERSATTRRALLDAARALFSERGYAGTAREDIVERAGVTRGALYHHFANKQAVFQAVFEELEAALDELPEEQRQVFLAHEVEGRTFKELAAETGLTVNTLLSRKHYAVIHLRERLQAIYDEFKEVRNQDQ